MDCCSENGAEGGSRHHGGIEEVDGKAIRTVDLLEQYLTRSDAGS